MPLNSLTIGPGHTLIQNEIYALPARAVLVYSSEDLEIASDAAFTTGTSAVSANIATEVSAGFVRCTVGAPIVFLKA